MRRVFFEKTDDPLKLDTQCVIMVKFEAPAEDETKDSIRSSKINIWNDGSSFCSIEKLFYELVFSFNKNYALHFETQEYFIQTLRECVFSAIGNDIDSIAIPLVFFEKLFPDFCFDTDSVWETLLFSLDLIEWLVNKRKIVFYNYDDNVEMDNIENKWVEAIKSALSFHVDKNEKKEFYDDLEKNAKLPLDDFIDKYMSRKLYEFINEYLDLQNIKPSDLYKKSQISKQEYHKIMTYPQLMSVKQQKKKYDLVSLLLGSEPDIQKFNQMLFTSGFALSDCNKKDLIIKYFIMNGNCNINDINTELEKRNLSIIGNALE